MLDILSTIGNTPLVELTNIIKGKSPIRLLAKVEGFNPGGSVKDRAALYMIREAENSGKLTKAKSILEATSGNTGIALAMIGAAKGYRVHIVIPACVSTERLKILEALGASIELTPAERGTDGAIERARQLLEQNPEKYYMPNQFANSCNCLAHYETTGPEIFAQTEGEVDVLVAGMGTTGTLMGAGKYLKEKKPSIKVIGVEPQIGHCIQGLKNLSEATVPEIFYPCLLDEKITVNDEEAFETTRRLALNEGIFAGMSSGAAIVGALRVARELQKGTIVTILPDRGDRYLSTHLFRSVCGKCPP
ncbi:MAG: cysteine synthase family protein [Clostridiales bacterium]|nr:cysteine synthase family protein [Clostridiales bacterium]